MTPNVLEAKDGHVILDIFGFGKPSPHTVELRANIAGYDTEVLPAAATVEWSCAVE